MMRPGNPRQAGFSYVIVLFALTIMGIGLAQVGEQWSQVARREKEAELIRAGEAVVRAIESYYLRSPGSARRFPANWEELLEDRRFVGTVRHLRRVPVDPFTRSADWTLVRAADGGIAGIRSRSLGTPLRQRAFEVGATAIPPADRYADWAFVYQAKDYK